MSAARALHVTLELVGGRRVAFLAAPGVTALVGPSGVGKTTVLRAIAGVSERATGRVALDREVWLDSAARVHLAPERRRVGLVPQGAALFPHLDVLGNVAFAVDRAHPRAERAARARRTLDEVGALALAARRPAGLSGGEAQRVALARALARAPEVLLLDEPLSALDAGAAAALTELVAERTRALGLITIWVSHAPLGVAPTQTITL